MEVKPSTVIRHDYSGFSKYCHEIDEPVLLTRNGEADLVVMSYEAFRRSEARFRLQSKLMVGERQLAEDAPLMEHHDVVQRMRERINATKA